MILLSRIPATAWVEWSTNRHTFRVRTKRFSNPAWSLRIQIYAALIASLLIVLWTGRKPTKRTLEMLQFYFAGMADLEEVEAHIASLQKRAR